MSAARDRTFVVASLLFGAMWLVAALGKIASPLAPYELVARVAPPGAGSKALLALAVAGEATLGAAMTLRVVRGFGLSLAALAVASGVLLAVLSTDGELVPCACFGDAFGATVRESLVRNAVLGAALVALILWGRRRDPA
jgi:hypothetical protein